MTRKADAAPLSRRPGEPVADADMARRPEGGLPGGGADPLLNDVRELGGMVDRAGATALVLWLAGEDPRDLSEPAEDLGTVIPARSGRGNPPWKL